MKVLACLFLLVPVLSVAAPVQLVSRGDANANYAIGVIKLALTKAAGPYEVVIRDDAWTEQRIRQALLDGQVDITWTATSKELEEALIPVRIPLYKGLLGYRVLIVHQDNQRLFDNVTSLA